MLAPCLAPAAAWADGASFTVRPVDAGAIAAFDGPPAPWLPGHRGVDFKALTGTVVRAPADGVVSFAATVVDRPVVSVRHAPWGSREVLSSFEPVVAAVIPGQRVRAGQVIGWKGSGGHCTAGCVHWGVRVGSNYVDPLGMLAASVRLLPLEPTPVQLPIPLPRLPSPEVVGGLGLGPGPSAVPASPWLRAVLTWR